MVLGMLVQLGKQETVSAMDTVKKSYSCYARHGAWFRMVQRGKAAVQNGSIWFNRIIA